MKVHRLPPNEFCHHGIKGQRWGVRRFQNPDGSLTAAGRERYGTLKYKSKNIDKWGKSENNNILYITGFSGSGKSTLARNLMDKNTEVIHLDQYLETNGDRSYRNKDLDKYLKSKKFDTEKLTDLSLDRKERWKQIDKFGEELLQDYSKQCYKNNRKVIVEGVQLLDETMFPDKHFFDGKPLITMETGVLSSSIRAYKRDNIKIDKELLNWKRYQKQQIKSISTEKMKKGKMIVDKYKTVKVY